MCRLLPTSEFKEAPESRKVVDCNPLNCPLLLLHSMGVCNPCKPGQTLSGFLQFPCSGFFFTCSASLVGKGHFTVLTAFCGKISLVERCIGSILHIGYNILSGRVVAVIVFM